MFGIIKSLLSAGKKVFNNDATVEPAFHQSCAAIFDDDFYLSAYPDIAAAGVNPFTHFITHGYREGRLPLDIQASDAGERIRKALDQYPGNRIAIELYVTLALLSCDVKKINNALSLSSSHADKASSTDKYLDLFESSAVNLYLKRHNGEINVSFVDLQSSLEKISAFFPQSRRIKSALAMTIFRTGRLKLADSMLSAIGDQGDPSQAFSVCMVEARDILKEARTVNRNTAAKSELLLLDSSFPSKISSFRYGEFLTYLGVFDKSILYCRPDDLRRYGEKLSFSERVEQLEMESGLKQHRIRYFDKDEVGPSKVAYCVFLNLADYFFTEIELPSVDNFIFTLYPGGGFELNSSPSDSKLRRLCENPKLQKIITTQIVTYRYLIDKGFCSAERILHIYGGIIPHIYSGADFDRVIRLTEKPLDICFVAQRYSANGAEKGYDVFVDVVRKFANSTDVRFHVVGGFDRDVIDLDGAQNITFYGTQPAGFFDNFYRSMDLILSPNINASALNSEAPDAFDGFPTTAVVEAGLRGVAIFLTDFMNLNRRLDGTQIFETSEMHQIDRNADAIALSILQYITEREALHSLGEAGRKAILREFGFEMQMQPRINLLAKYLRHDN